MAQENWREVAEAAGLGVALREHLEDVRAAAVAAAAAAGGIAVVTDPRVEPWPPMRVVGRVVGQP